GYSLEAVKEAADRGRLAFGYAEDVFQVPEGRYTREEAARETGLEPELIDRLMTLLGTPMGAEDLLNEEDLDAMRTCPEALAPRFSWAAFLRVVGSHPRSLRGLPAAGVRLSPLSAQEPLMQEEVPPLEIAEEMGDLAADLLPVTAPLMEYMHNR